MGAFPFFRSARAAKTQPSVLATACRTVLRPQARVFVALALLAGALPSLAANRVLVATDTCSGNRQTTEADVFRIECSDNFTLTDGTITSDVKVVISGASSLTITNVRIVAPAVELQSDGHVSLGGGTGIEAPAAQDFGGSGVGLDVVVILLAAVVALGAYFKGRNDQGA